MENLDAMDADDLWAFALSCRGVRPTKAARKLFPGRTKGSITATKLVRGYAENKSTAMKCRARGDITTALIYENICDDIYKRLPDWARW